MKLKLLPTPSSRAPRPGRPSAPPGRAQAGAPSRLAGFVARVAILACTTLLPWTAPAIELRVPVVTTTNVGVRVMAANLNGSVQNLQPFALRILQGLKPDVVAIQEFNYLNNTATSFRLMIDATFGTNYSYFRESGYGIPNGVISRWPIRRSGSWVDSDVGVNDRGFAWAEIDIPGPEDLIVVSVHLKASDGADNILRRGNQALEVKSLIQANFPTNRFIIVAGDCNIFSPTEPAMDTFRSFLTDPEPPPTDAVSGGNPNTNLGRNRRYDYVFPSPWLNSNRVATVIGTNRFPNGLVFDSRVYATSFSLADVAPIEAGDSGLAQHMAVLKDFQITATVTNVVPVTPPLVRWIAPSEVAWDGLPGLTYTIEQGTLSGLWSAIGTASSDTSSFRFTVTDAPAIPSEGPRFFRVRYP